MLQVNKRIQLTGHNASVFALAQDAKPACFLSGAGEGWLVRWHLDDPETGRLVAKVDSQIFSACSLPEYDLLAAGNMNGGLHWIHPDKPEENRNVAHHKKGIFAMQQLGPHLLTAGGQGLLTRWSIEEKRTLESLQLSHQSLRCMAFSPERNELAVGGSDNAIYLLEATSMRLKYSIKGAHENSVFSLAFAPDGNTLLSGSRDAHLKVWNPDTAECLSAQPAHWFTINAIAFHPKGHLFATASRDKTIKIWDANNWQLLKVLDTIRDGGHINSVNNILWSNYNQQLISCSDDRSIILWDVTQTA